MFVFFDWTPQATAITFLLLLAALAATLLALVNARTWARRTSGDLEAVRGRLEQTTLQAERQGVQLEERSARILSLTSDLEGLRKRFDEAGVTHNHAQTELSRLNEAVRRMEQAAETSVSEMKALSDRHDLLQKEHGALQSRHAALQADTDGKLELARREVAALKEIREEIARQFEETANSALRKTGSEFSVAQAEKLKELLTPFREHIGRFETELRKVHGEADRERARPVSR